jgi:arginyl-tRNA--protein-N-Asp/Glu arginylyltransferase
MTVYKPDMRRTCCPTYTIRLEADSFSPSKDQARVLHRMQRYHDFCSPLLEALNFRDSWPFLRLLQLLVHAHKK